MNYPYVVHQLGKLLVLFSVAMAGLVVVGWLIDVIDGEPVVWIAEAALLIACGLCLVVGSAAWLATRRFNRFLGRREAMLLVAASWIIGAVFAALPYYIWAHLPAAGVAADHPFRSFVSCYFEAMSGLTTTGATVLSDIEAVPRKLLLWRGFTHFIGGLGIVVLFVAVLPSIGVGGKKLFLVEAPGPSPEGLQPRIGETARILWLIYLSLTVLQMVALIVFGGMSLFDSVCHTFATIGTAGFSTKNASVGAYYDRAAVDVIVVFFMVLAGVNFGLYYRLWRRRTLTVLKDTEFILYLVVFAIGAAIVTASLMYDGRPIVLTKGATEVDPTFATALRVSVVNTASIHTTTGFCTSDTNQWPFLGRAVLIAFMFIGGCSGSTAGGIKVIRIWIAIKVFQAQIERYFRPDVTRPIRVGGTTLDMKFQLSAIAYVLGIVLLFGMGWAALMLLELANADSDCSSATAAAASLATVCTIGPGFAGVGAVENYGWFSAPSKLVMCVLMALGRLEVFAIIVLFKLSFWRMD